MQVSVETTDKLERRITASVAADKIESEIEKRLKSMAPNVKMDGFRPGKVPMRVVKQRYGAQVRNDVLNDLITSTYYDAVKEQDLHPAGLPNIEPKDITPGQDVEFTATFEVYPTIEVQGTNEIEIDRPTSSISDKEIDEMIDKLRKQRVTWETADRGAQEEDRVTVDFKATIDGEVFEGGEGKGMPVVIGSGQMIEGFEDALLGAKEGQTVEKDLPFPDDYHKADLAGKTAHFVLEVTKVEAPVLPEADDEFAAGFGVKEGGIKAFREDVAKNMQRELDSAIKSRVKNAVMDALLEKNSFDIPKAMVEAEGSRMADQMNEQLKARGGNVPAGMEFTADQFKEQSERRVALGLILSEIIKKNELKADPERVKTEIENIASAYEDPQEVMKWYLNNRDRMHEIESLVLEDQIVDWVLDQAKVTEKAMTFDELVNNSQQ